ncbi:MAG: hypothetical protein JRN39_02805 [Nitrososphaerota archaeon]|nr:hypothetical protein [Nitrososphaerota archaeon]MDG6939311.1 hypothetical protein [Nitrososphaerota archaeon]
MKCHYCDTEEPFPFRCSYCGENYCGEHRIPENHFCPMYAVARPPRGGYASTADGDVSFTPTFRPGRVGRREALSLLGGMALVWLVGLSILLQYYPSSTPLNLALVVNGSLFVASFVLHEYAHKYSANLHGLWAEFRLNLTGVIFTVISIFSPFLKVIAPGATMIFGSADDATMGRIAMWGPVVNIAMSAVLLPVVLIAPLIVPAYMLNSFIAVFNLVPLGILDGRKIFVWRRNVWGLMMGYSVVVLLAVGLYFGIF